MWTIISEKTAQNKAELKCKLPLDLPLSSIVSTALFMTPD
jgi:hypothetical protein